MKENNLIHERVETLLSRFPNLNEFFKKLGNTPLIELPTPQGYGRIFAKCEFGNPTGTVKDRAAFFMLAYELAELNDLELRRKKLLAYSGGSLAISLAHLSALMKLPLMLVMGDGISPRLLDLLTSLGAEVELVEKEKGFWGTMEHAHYISQNSSEYLFLNQHESKANIIGHELTTGNEILSQIDSAIHGWTAAVGTGGTLMGVANAIIKCNSPLEVYAVSPSELPYGSWEPPNSKPKFAGSGGLGNGRKQYFLENQESIISGHYSFSLEEARETMLQFLLDFGIRIGSSSAANFKSAMRMAKRLGSGKTVVTIFPDAGSPEEWKALCR